MFDLIEKVKRFNNNKDQSHDDNSVKEIKEIIEELSGNLKANIDNNNNNIV